MTIGDKIRFYRLERGFTQKELGDMCGLADSAIRRYESGKVKPKYETLKRIGNALGVFIFDFLDSDEDAKVRFVNPLIDEDPYTELGNLRGEIAHLSLSLNEKGLKKTADYMQDLIEIPEYKIGN